MPEFIDLTPENLAAEHLCCLIRAKPNAGVDAKRAWLAARLPEGHVFRKLNEKATVFIEYAPLETAWVPIVGDNYYYIYCLWVVGADHRGKGYGRALMESCLADAKAHGKSGVCMLGSAKQKLWLSDQSFARKFGFEIADTTDYGYELLALSFDGRAPRFAPSVKDPHVPGDDLTIYYSAQCPYVPQYVAAIEKYCEARAVPLTLVEVASLQQAKDLPCVFNNFAVFYKGRFRTVNLLDTATIERLLKK